MKNLNIAYYISCSFLVTILFSCEKADIQKTHTTLNDSHLQLRSDCVDECEDCPVEDCCCSVTITEGGPTELTLCGTTDPCLSTEECGPTEAESCTISGYTLNMSLSSSGVATGLFCAAKGTPFYIESSQPVTARITCRVGQTPPQVVTVTFNTPPITNKVYYTANGDCELVSCL